MDVPLALLLAFACNVQPGGIFAGTTGMRRASMAWTRPKLREICIGMEINSYVSATL